MYTVIIITCIQIELVDFSTKHFVSVQSKKKQYIYKSLIQDSFPAHSSTPRPLIHSPPTHPSNTLVTIVCTGLVINSTSSSANLMAAALTSLAEFLPTLEGIIEGNDIHVHVQCKYSVNTCTAVPTKRKCQSGSQTDTLLLT